MERGGVDRQRRKLTCTYVEPPAYAISVGRTMISFTLTWRGRVTM